MNTFLLFTLSLQIQLLTCQNSAPCKWINDGGSTLVALDVCGWLDADGSNLPVKLRCSPDNSFVEIVVYNSVIDCNADTNDIYISPEKITNHSLFNCNLPKCSDIAIWQIYTNPDCSSYNSWIQNIDQCSQINGQWYIQRAYYDFAVNGGEMVYYYDSECNEIDRCVQWNEWWPNDCPKDYVSLVGSAHNKSLCGGCDKPGLGPGVSSASCDWYINCLEGFKTCTDEGYAIAYGNYYCEEFLQNIYEFSTAGQAWIDSVRLCLQTALVPVINTDTSSTTCDDITDAGFATHSNCYIDGGICFLSPLDWAKIIGVVNTGLVSSFSAVEEMLVVMGTCIESYAYIYTLTAGHLASFDQFIEILSNMGETVNEWAYDILSENMFNSGSLLNEKIVGDIQILDVSEGSIKIHFVIISENKNITELMQQQFESIVNVEITIGNDTIDKIIFSELFWDNDPTITTTDIPQFTSTDNQQFTSTVQFTTTDKQQITSTKMYTSSSTILVEETNVGLSDRNYPSFNILLLVAIFVLVS
eukprot:298611_1